MKKIAFISISVILMTLLAVFVYTTTRTEPQANQQAMQAPPVTVTNPVIRDVNEYYEFTGYTQAVEDVEIRARVSGYLQEINFHDSTDVKKGDLLFVIEPDPYIANRDQAQAELISAKAELQRTSTDLERLEKAAESNAVSRQQVTRMQAEKQKAQAEVKRAEAALKKAELDLSYTKIKSPIDGRVGRNLVDTGNLVGQGNNTLLTTVVKLQPIYIYFDVSEQVLNEYFLNHSPNGNGSNQAFYAGTPNSSDFPHKGHLNFIANKVDRATGTIMVRGQVPNQDRTLLPGMFVRVKVPARTIKNAVLVKETAINSDIGGKFVYVLDKDNIPQRTFIQLGKKIDQYRVVTAGLNGTESYVLKGFHSIRPNSPVSPVHENETLSSKHQTAKN